jgi:hypothetical protein
MRVVLITFGGRQCTLEILFYYILKYRSYINEYRIFIATNIKTDLDYMVEFKERNPEFVKLVYTYDEKGVIENDKNRIWDNAYRQCQEDDTVYIKFDDDIVYFDETLFTDFLNYRIANPEIPLVFPTIINNAYFSWLLEKKNIYNPVSMHLHSNIGDTWPTTYTRIKSQIIECKDNVSLKNKLKIGNLTKLKEVLCPVAWGSLDYCVNLHRQFLEDLSSGVLYKYKLGKMELSNRDPVSISCCSWIGSTLKSITNQVGNVFDDEPWWCVWMPTWLDKNNAVYGDCVIAHYAYYKQRELGLDSTSILDNYKKLIN